MKIPDIPAALVERYNRPGPRYTSYPTAPQFSDAVGAGAVEKALRTSRPEADLSLYFHLPFCRSLCNYCGCHMMVTHRPEKIEGYLAYLHREIDAVSEKLTEGRTVRQIHWGGGTPTFLEPDQIESLMAHTRKRFAVAEDAEISIEADPRGLSEAHVAAIQRAGFNRVSFGVQDFDEEVQTAIGRVQPEALVAEAVASVRAAGIESVNFDLIYGLPHQTTASFRNTIDLVNALRPERISLFSYAHVPWLKKHQRTIPTDALPGADEKLDIFMLAVERLTSEGGYRYIGMDHFARPEDDLCRAQDNGTLHRNFQGYSTHAGADLLGFGISSIGLLDDLFYQNVKDLRPYYSAIDGGRLPIERGVRLTEDDRLRRHVITQVMCNFRLELADVERRFGIGFHDYFADAWSELEGMEADGLVRLSPDRIEVTDTGRFFIRNIAMPFDAYLPKKEAAQRPMYSQTV